LRLNDGQAGSYASGSVSTNALVSGIESFG
jgi:hypothetical protein